MFSIDGRKLEVQLVIHRDEMIGCLIWGLNVVLSARLERPGIKAKTPAIQDEWHSHYITDALGMK